MTGTMLAEGHRANVHGSYRERQNTSRVMKNIIVTMLLWWLLISTYIHTDTSILDHESEVDMTGCFVFIRTSPKEKEELCTQKS